MNGKDILRAMDTFDEKLICDASMDAIKENVQSQKRKMNYRNMRMVLAAAAVVLLCMGGSAAYSQWSKKQSVVAENGQASGGDEQAHISKNYENLNTLADKDCCELRDGMVQDAAHGYTLELPKQGSVTCSDTLNTALQLYTAADTKFLVEITLETDSDARGNMANDLVAMKKEADRLKLQGLDIIWVPAGNYEQQDGKVLYFSRNKIYARVTADQIRDFPVTEQLGYGLVLGKYKDYCYVDGIYEQFWNVDIGIGDNNEEK